jgi:hypothetical protein
VPEGIRTDECAVRVEENAYVPGVEPAKFMRGEKPPYGRCFTELGVRMRAMEIACTEGYPLVSLVNIRRPGLVMGACYRADMEFYDTARDVRIAERPLVRDGGIPSTGCHVVTKVGFGPVLAGPQSRSGLVNEEGKEASTRKTGVSAVLRYYPLRWVGVEAETGGLFAAVSAEGTGSMDFTQSWTSTLGVTVVPWQELTGAGRLQVAASGGMAYTRLARSKEYTDFVEERTVLVYPEEAAGGPGWYGAAHLRLLTVAGLMGEAGARYLAEYPEFPSAGPSFWGTNLLFDLGVGYWF